MDESRRFVIYKRFKAAIRDGVLLAVPVEGTVEIPRKTTPLSVPEHLIASDAVTWLQSVLAEMNKPKKGARRISALESDIVEGRVSFEEVPSESATESETEAGTKEDHLTSQMGRLWPELPTFPRLAPPFSGDPEIPFSLAIGESKQDKFSIRLQRSRMLNGG